MQISKFLTEDEFKMVMSTLVLAEKHAEIAKAALVHKVKPQELANQYGLNKQSVSQIVRRVWQGFLEMQHVPKDWVSIRVSLPPKEAERVLALETELKAKSLLKKPRVYNFS